MNEMERVKYAIEEWKLNTDVSFGPPNQSDKSDFQNIFDILRNLDFSLEDGNTVGDLLTLEFDNHHPTLQQLESGITYCFTRQKLNPNGRGLSVIGSGWSGIKLPNGEILIKQYGKIDGVGTFKCERFYIKGGKFRFNHFFRFDSGIISTEIARCMSQVKKGRYDKFPSYSEIFSSPLSSRYSEGKSYIVCINLNCKCGNLVFKRKEALHLHWKKQQLNTDNIHHTAMRIFTHEQPIERIRLKSREIFYLMFIEIWNRFSTLAEYDFHESYIPNLLEFQDRMKNIKIEDFISYFDGGSDEETDQNEEESDEETDQSEEEPYEKMQCDPVKPKANWNETKEIQLEIPYELGKKRYNLKLIYKKHVARDSITLIIDNRFHIEISNIHCLFENLFEDMKLKWKELPILSKKNKALQYSMENHKNPPGSKDINIYIFDQLTSPQSSSIIFGGVLFCLIDKQPVSSFETINIPDSEPQCLQIGIESDYTHYWDLLRNGLDLPSKDQLKWHIASLPTPPTNEVQYATFITTTANTYIMISHKRCMDLKCQHKEDSLGCVSHDTESISRILIKNGDLVSNFVQERRLVKVLGIQKEIEKRKSIPFFCFGTWYSGSIPLIV